MFTVVGKYVFEATVDMYLKQLCFYLYYMTISSVILNDAEIFLQKHDADLVCRV